ncbi:MAG TPA: FkbM family methyltransferase [Patescibacteria group bacterium]|nr:FkbM family methyltransferase [Patescibacteria group bacterium]
MLERKIIDFRPKLSVVEKYSGPNDIKDVLRRACVQRTHWGNGVLLYDSSVRFGPLVGQVVTADTPLGALRYSLGMYEPDVKKAMLNLAQNGVLKNGSVAYDIGANIGIHTLALSKLVGSEGRVVSFEPSSASDVLDINLSQNGITNAQVVRKAVSDSDGDVPFFLHEYSFGNHIAQVSNELKKAKKVPEISIDSFVQQGLAKPPDFMKIDVEGAELQVIQGAQNTLGRYHPAVIMEVRPEYFQEIENIFRQRSYTWRLLSGRNSFPYKNDTPNYLFIKREMRRNKGID